MQQAQGDCRLCSKHRETLGHILSNCPIYEHKEYRRRHDVVLYLLVKAIGGKLGHKIPKSLMVPGGGIRCGVMGTRDWKMIIDLCSSHDQGEEVSLFSGDPSDTDKRKNFVVLIGRIIRARISKIAHDNFLPINRSSGRTLLCLIGPILMKRIPFFKKFSKGLEMHIQHEYSEEMSRSNNFGAGEGHLGSPMSVPAKPPIPKGVDRENESRQHMSRHGRWP